MHKIIFTALLLILQIASLKAQTTIGSNKKPQPGALLDISENLNGGDTAPSNSSRGLMLPRVKILDLNKLQVEGGTDLTSSGALSHIGLTVYNVNPNFDRCDENSIPPGPHVWTGTKWESLKAIDEHASAIIPDPRTKSPLFNTNTYMVTTIGSSDVVTIPIIKAFYVWKYLGPNPPDTSFDELNLKGLLPSRTFSGSLSAKIEWQEGLGQPGDANDPIINGTPTLSSTNVNDENATITVQTTGNKGNAVISLSDDNGVIWSWHIWVTPQPQTIEFNGIKWMDRNLGATAAVSGDNGSVGLHYQFGRHSPIPLTRKLIPTSFEGIISFDPYRSLVNINIADNSAEIYKLNGRGEETGLEYSIKNPLSYIKLGAWDWYGALTVGEKYSNRWEQITLKDNCSGKITGYLSPITNPCPDGWKIAEGKENADPLPKYLFFSIIPATPSTGDGRIIQSASLFFPNAGDTNHNGVTENIGNLIWFSTMRIHSDNILVADGHQFRTKDNSVGYARIYTTYRTSVRCVQKDVLP